MPIYNANMASGTYKTIRIGGIKMKKFTAMLLCLLLIACLSTAAF